MTIQPAVFNTVVVGMTGGYQARKAIPNPALLAEIAASIDTQLNLEDEPTREEQALLRAISYGIASKPLYTSDQKARLVRTVIELYDTMKTQLVPVEVFNGAANIQPGDIVGQNLAWNGFENWIPGNGTIKIPGIVSATAEFENIKVPKIQFNADDNYLVASIGYQNQVPTADAFSSTYVYNYAKIEMRLNEDDIVNPSPVGKPSIKLRYNHSSFEMRKHRMLLYTNDIYASSHQYAENGGHFTDGLSLNFSGEDSGRGIGFFGSLGTYRREVKNPILNLSPPNINNQTTLVWILKQYGLITYTDAPPL